MVVVRAFILTAILVGPAICSAWEAPGQVDDGFTTDSADWPWWRGPSRNGIADPNQDPPTEWSEEKNVAWKSPIPAVDMVRPPLSPTESSWRRPMKPRGVNQSFVSTARQASRTG